MHILISDSGVTYSSLVYLSKDDIEDAIVDIGLRAEFRHKLFNWKKVEVSKYEYMPFHCSRIEFGERLLIKFTA